MVVCPRLGTASHGPWRTSKSSNSTKEHTWSQWNVRLTHGTRKRAEQALHALGYTQPNTSAIERRNGTARRMSSAFARRQDVKHALGWWGAPSTTGVASTARCACHSYNPWIKKVPAPFASDGCRSCRARSACVSTITFSRSANSCSHSSILLHSGDRTIA